jgi:hypothetical protein
LDEGQFSFPPEAAQTNALRSSSATDCAKAAMEKRPLRRWSLHRKGLFEFWMCDLDFQQFSEQNQDRQRWTVWIESLK